MSEAKPENLDSVYSKEVLSSGFLLVKNPKKIIPGDVVSELGNLSASVFIRNRINRLVSYHNSFYILDSYGNDHENRRKWRIETFHKLQGQQGEVVTNYSFIDFLKKDKLRANYIRGVLGAFSIIERTLWLEFRQGNISQEIYTRFRDLKNKVPIVEKYSEYSQDEKVRLVKLLEALIQELVQIYYKSFQLV